MRRFCAAMRSNFGIFRVRTYNIVRDVTIQCCDAIFWGEKIQYSQRCHNTVRQMMLQGTGPTFRICAPRSSHLQDSERIIARFFRCSLHLHIRYVEGGVLQSVSRNDTIRVSKGCSRAQLQLSESKMAVRYEGQHLLIEVEMGDFCLDFDFLSILHPLCFNGRFPGLGQDNIT